MREGAAIAREGALGRCAQVPAVGIRVELEIWCGHEQGRATARGAAQGAAVNMAATSTCYFDVRARLLRGVSAPMAEQCIRAGQGRARTEEDGEEEEGRFSRAA